MDTLSRDRALAFLRFMREYHAGKRNLPAEIVKKKKEIEQAIHHAELFVIHFRTVDYGLIIKALKLMLERDRLYDMWIKSETSSAPTLH